MYLLAKYKPVGDQALIIEFEDVVSPEINQQIRAMIKVIKNHKIKGIIELIPSYSSLMVYYDVQTIGFRELIKKLNSLERQIEDLEISEAEIIKVPTVYGDKYGPDIEDVAEYNGLSVDEVIEIHTSRPYLIYMLGFVPGFPYLGGMDKRIATPRLENPRTKIPAGSVGIAGEQTGIYPLDTPGGWRLIGRTYLKLYDLDSDEPFLLKVGDYLQFFQISKNEYESKVQEIGSG